MFTNLVGVGNIEVNAFQSLSRVIVQKSIREGFGLVVAESLWKGTPVVAGRAGGIPLQMADGTGGVLVDNVDECARALVTLLRDTARARALGATGKERVRNHFLIPRLVFNEISLLRALASARPIVRALDTRRDPVCGMALHGASNVTATVQGTAYAFCSEQCRSMFMEAPRRFVEPAPIVSAGLH